MQEIAIRLVAEADGSVGVSGANGGSAWEHQAPAEQVRAAAVRRRALMGGFESGHPPLADPVALAELGRALRDTFLPPLYGAGTDFPALGEGRLLFVSAEPGLLNLPWELLPGGDGQFLVADARWSLRRAVRPDLPPAAAPRVARPLRILFVACAPLDQPGWITNARRNSSSASPTGWATKSTWRSPKPARLTSCSSWSPNCGRRRASVRARGHARNGRRNGDWLRSGRSVPVPVSLAPIRTIGACPRFAAAWATLPSRTNAGGPIRAMRGRWPTGCSPAKACGWCFSAAARPRRPVRRGCARR